MWEKRISHSGLNAFRLVRAQSQYNVDTKAHHQIAQWEERWQNRLRVQRERARRSDQNATDQSNKAIAIGRNLDLETQRNTLATLLSCVVGAYTSLSWDSLKLNTPYSTPPPAHPKLQQHPLAPQPLSPPAIIVEPQLVVPKTVPPRWSILEQSIPLLRKKKQRWTDEQNSDRLSEAQMLYTASRNAWATAKQSRENEEKAFSQATDKYLARCKEVAEENSRLNASYHHEVDAWRKSKEDYQNEQAAANKRVEELRISYMAREPLAIKAYFYEVLAGSLYPDSFPREHFLEITPEKTLILDFELPNLAALSNVKEVKYIVARSSFQEVTQSDASMKRTYDEVLYQICLRTTYELFSSDTINAIDSIVFNGWVRSIDRATGSDVHACIMSLEAGKDEFLAINLAQVEPRACFKNSREWLLADW